MVLHITGQTVSMGLDISGWGELERCTDSVLLNQNRGERNKKCSSREFHKNDLSWTLEYDIWIELDLGKGRVEESEGRKESSTAESGE